MTIKPIRRFGDPVLRTVADPVTVFDDRTTSLVDDLLDTVTEPGRAGVAAPQIGVSLRAFSYNVNGDKGYVLNPELVEVSGEQDGEEGCLSVPGLSYPTHRASYAKVRGVNLRNEPVTVEGTDLMARCLQHETDHLDGIVYLQRLEPEQRRTALKEVRATDWFWNGS